MNRYLIVIKSELGIIEKFTRWKYSNQNSAVRGMGLLNSSDGRKVLYTFKIKPK